MKTLTHPHISPPLEIEVADEHVESHLSAGWLQAKPARKKKQPLPPIETASPGEVNEQETHA